VEMPEKFAHGVFIARCDPMKASRLVKILIWHGR